MWLLKIPCYSCIVNKEVVEMSKILVCDDDKEIVEAIDIYLTQEGYTVRKAYDGEEALKILKEEEIDLLIIDVMMPRLDGIRATLKIREENNIPIIILSAKSEDADKILGLNVGADDYVTKPFNPLELVARVKSQMRRYTQNQGKVFSIDQIYENIWNEDAIGVDNTVAVHIRHIREKIEINPKEPRYLKVVWGVGYKVEKL